MKNFIITMLFALTVSCVWSHSLIKGTVSDSLSGVKLVGASIVLNGNGQAVTTDVLGNFRIDGLADGTYLLKCTFIGYRSETIRIVLTGMESKIINIKLSPSQLSLDEITVTGTSTTEQVMTTINKIDIELRPLKSSQDVLRMIPGLVTAQHAGGGKAEQIFLRGFDIDHGTDISLSVDGMPVNMVSHAHGQGYADLHFLIPELIDYVNFNKGPYYSSVGDFNTAGFANFQTQKFAG